MLLEDILLVVAVGVVLAMVGWPIYYFFHRAPWRRRKDPLAEAHERLRVAQLDAEADEGEPRGGEDLRGDVQGSARGQR